MLLLYYFLYTCYWSLRDCSNLKILGLHQEFPTAIFNRQPNLISILVKVKRQPPLRSCIVHCTAMKPSISPVLFPSVHSWESFPLALYFNCHASKGLATVMPQKVNHPRCHCTRVLVSETADYNLLGHQQHWSAKFKLDYWVNHATLFKVTRQ